MKKIFILISILASGYFATAQDLITLNNGTEIHTRILNFNEQSVVTCAPGLSDTLVIDRKEVAKIRYQNGIIIMLSDALPARDTTGRIEGDLYMRGVSDANIYYQGYKAAGTGSLFSGIMLLYGAATPIICSLTPPASKNLGFPDQRLMDNWSYRQGYTNQAYKIKKRKVWMNYGIGAGSTLVIGFAGLFMIIAAYSY